MPGVDKMAATARRVDAAGDELYALAPRDFTSARAEHVKRAKADGDADAARSIARLAKPTVAAWLVNQLTRERRDDVDALLRLGESMRAATAELDARRLRELSAEQRGSIADLLAHAERMAADADLPMSEPTHRGVDDTLHAAMVDPDAADQLRTGRIATVLSSSGFPGIELSAASPTAGRQAKPANNRRPQSAPATKKKAAGGSAKKTESVPGATARAAHRRAEADSKEAHRAIERAEAQTRRISERIDRLQADLDDVRRSRSDAEKQHRKAVRAAADADRVLRAARARLDGPT